MVETMTSETKDPLELQEMSSDIDDIIGRLNSGLEPDRDIESPAEETSLTSSSASASISDSTSLTRTPSSTSSQKELVVPNGQSNTDKNSETKDKQSKHAGTTNRRSSGESTSGGIISKIMSPFEKFKKKSQKEQENEEKAARFERMLAAVHVEGLPQLFVTKYLGFKVTKGLYGVKYTRGVAEELISGIGDHEKQKELPLAQLHVSLRGIHISEHKESTVKGKLHDLGLIPLEFISYGVQDIRYTRVFTFILVKEMSSKSRTLECHAYLCDSSITCRKLALSLSLAFQEYAKTLEGKPHKFKVDLRSMKEIDQDIAQGGEESHKTNAEDECEA